MIFCKTASQVSVSVSVSIEVIGGYKKITFQTSIESVYIKKKYHFLEEKRISQKIYRKNITKSISL